MLLIAFLALLGTTLVGTFAPEEWYWGTIGSVALGAIVALTADFGGADIVLSISRARPATPEEDRVLQNVVEEMALAAGVPVPLIYVIDDPALNAFATGPSPEHAVIAVTSGLLAKLDRDELQGVVAHEMGHIRNFDIQFMTRMTLIAGLIPLIADLLLRLRWFGIGRGRHGGRHGSNFGAIFLVVGLLLAVLAPLGSMLLTLAVSRKREFLADATAAELTRYPEGLARALAKLGSEGQSKAFSNRATQHLFIVNPLSSGTKKSRLFQTHPSIEERIAALQNLMGQFPSPNSTDTSRA